MSDWVRAVYDDADSLDAAAFAARFAPDASFAMGNNPPLTGPAEIEAGLKGFFGLIAGMRHDFSHRYTVGSVEVMEAAVTYTRLDGSTVTVPGASVTERSGDVITAMRAYIDVAPLFAGGGAA
ncbi:nuclear transport factor 2 family protein [Kineosporia sp. R_H_3]|uniref:nuclear transport factor 2 family protein n=1 Tax=Kineosporia sp. R_H_3 TaxID=1961848 RepID=UPI00130461CD|nr:nuclear transport factor 2 family protein [Kineosporia sp. R_H_3]